MSDSSELAKVTVERIYIPAWMYDVPDEWKQFYFDEVAGMYAVSVKWGNC